MASGRATGGQVSKRQPHGGGKQRPQSEEPPSVNADGFQTVTRHVRPRVGEAPPNNGAKAVGMQSATEDHGRPASWAEVARRPAPAATTDAVDLRDDDDDMDRGDSDDEHRGDGPPGDASDLEAVDFDEGDDEADEYDDDACAEDRADVSEGALRRAWEEAKVACRRLERTDGIPLAVVEAARRHRDESEASWRAAKRPHPLHKRLRWAQRDLDAALAKQQEHQADMERALDDMAQRRRFLEERAEADRLRTERRRRALQALHEDGALPTTTACEDAAKAAVLGIQSDLGPTLCGVADKLECGSPAWLELQAAMSALQQVQGLLQGACTEVEAERTATSDQADDGDQWRQRRQQQQQRQACGGPTCFDIGDNSGPNGQAAAAAVPASAVGRDGAGGAGKPSIAVARWAGPSRVEADKWGGPAWKKTRQAQGDVAARPPTAAGGGGAPTPSSAGAKEEAQRQLAEHQAQLVEAQAREKAVADAARARQEQAAREHQLQLAQQQRAAADAAEAAETVRRAQEAVARAQAEEANRIGREKQEAAARMSPEERRMAEDLHAQQMAIAAAGFGTQQAVHGACLVRQAAAGAGGGAGDGVDDIMAMSPEQWQESLPVDSSAAGW